MSNSRRRSSRRRKNLGLVYSSNDLVQIPYNSTTLIGRLTYKLTERPSVRWLVSFDDIPSRKDEEIAEEEIGPVVGHIGVTLKTNSNSTSNGESFGVVTPSTDDNIAPAINSDKVTTRSLRKRKTPEGNACHNVDDSTTSMKHRVLKANSDAPSTVAFEKVDLPNEKVPSSIGITQEIIPTSSNITSRERRSRRRQASTHDEISEHTMSPTSTMTTTSPFTNGGLPLKCKRSIAQNSVVKARGDNHLKNKKAKIVVSDHSLVCRKNEVLKVQLLTGTLYLYHGAQRHVEFIPKY